MTRVIYPLIFINERNRLKSGLTDKTSFETLLLIPIILNVLHKFKIHKLENKCLGTNICCVLILYDIS